mmetsp:Transcript_118378/g.377338  ORF Transcript_118378/g.377338 Transcript_118378/m.377338 type:complete len:282 (+) Transcript_118378:110-955(+)
MTSRSSQDGSTTSFSSSSVPKKGSSKTNSSGWRSPSPVTAASLASSSLRSPTVAPRRTFTTSFKSRSRSVYTTTSCNSSWPAISLATGTGPSGTAASLTPSSSFLLSSSTLRCSSRFASCCLLDSSSLLATSAGRCSSSRLLCSSCFASCCLVDSSSLLASSARLRSSSRCLSASCFPVASASSAFLRSSSLRLASSAPARSCSRRLVSSLRFSSSFLDVSCIVFWCSSRRLFSSSFRLAASCRTSTCFCASACLLLSNSSSAALSCRRRSSTSASRRCCA